MHVDGACHCGAIRFTAEVDPARVVVCHCTDCQVLSGSPFRVVALAPIESVRMDGAPKHYIKRAESGSRRLQAFCPECGTPLYSSAVDNPRHLGLRLGALRQRAALTPVLQIWKRSSLPWLDGLPSMPGCLQQEALQPR
jgi:hypothetical protein